MRDRLNRIYKIIIKRNDSYHTRLFIYTFILYDILTACFCFYEIAVTAYSSFSLNYKIEWIRLARKFLISSHAVFVLSTTFPVAITRET